MDARYPASAHRQSRGAGEGARRGTAGRRQSRGPAHPDRAYRERTAPLVDYYRGQGALKSVDGMAPIAEVASAIDRLLDAGSAKKASRKKAAAKSGSPPRRWPGKRDSDDEGNERARSLPRPSSPSVGASADRGRKAATRGRRRCAKANRAEVDERQLNPLISPASSRRSSNDAGPREPGRVSCYRLRQPLPKTGQSISAGRFPSRQQE